MSLETPNILFARSASYGILPLANCTASDFPKKHDEPPPVGVRWYVPNPLWPTSFTCSGFAEPSGKRLRIRRLVQPRIPFHKEEK
jgi:hypothetical protein